MKRFFKWIQSWFGKKQDSITIPPKEPLPPVPAPKPEPVPVPPDPEPEPVPVPPIPAPIDWESMSCREIKAKISEIEQLLLTSKFIELIRVYWEEQLAIGLKVYSKKCVSSL